MIAGVGADIVALGRFQRLLEGRSGERFVRRVLTEAERAAAGRSASQERYAEFVAGRWAAKEAVAKALGCGIGRTVAFRDMEVLPDERGRPVCTLSEAAWERLGERLRLHVSITHADGWVAAFAVAERIER